MKTQKVSRQKPRKIRIKHGKLTATQLISIQEMFDGSPTNFYLQCRRLANTIIKFQAIYACDGDNWSKGMIYHYQEILKIMDSFHKTWQLLVRSGEQFELEIRYAIAT